MEMKDCYYSSIKFFQDTKNEKQLKKIIEEFEKFFDFYFPARTLSVSAWILFMGLRSSEMERSLFSESMI